MLNNDDKVFLESFSRKLYPHASNILTKNSQSSNFSDAKREAFPRIVEQYLFFLRGNNAIIGFTEEKIIERTNLLNNYYNFIEENNYHNIFKSQSKFRPTIIEEFMYILFKDLINSKKEEFGDVGNLIEIGTQSYTNLFFSGENFKDFIENPKIIVNQKNQDFCIYRTIQIKFGDTIKTLKIPIFSIENIY